MLYASGVDRAEGAWVSRWTLYDFFFVLIATLAAARLFGWRVGLLAFAALTLSWHVPGMPRMGWFVLLAAGALARALPIGRWRLAATVINRAVAIAIALLLIPFAVQQLREALHPSLETVGGVVSLSGAMDSISQLGRRDAGLAGAPASPAPMAT